MIHLTPEQEQIIQMVRDRNCSDVLKMISEKELRKYPPSYISRLLFELIPQTSKDSKQLADLIVKYGRPDWNARGSEGRMLHAVFIRYSRVDLAARALERLRKKDVRSTELSPVWCSLLCWFIDKKQRTAVLNMIRQGVMIHMDEEEKKRILKRILSYQDISILKAAGKYINGIPASLLREPENLSGQQFMREVLNTYRREISVGEDAKKVWAIAVKCEAEEMLKYLLKKSEAYGHLPELAAGNDDMFRLILQVRNRNILDEVKREVLYGALESGSPKERFELLINKGWGRSSQDTKKEIPLADEYMKRMEQKRYGSDKSGRLEQIKDHTGLRIIILYEQKNI